MKVLNFDGTIYSARAGTAALPGISFANDTNTGIYSPGADQVAISTGGTGRLFVDASGRVLVGTTSSTAFASSNPTLQVVGDDFSNSTIGLRRSVDGTNGPSVVFACSNGTVASPTIVADDDELAKFRFYGYNGNNFNSYAAEIAAFVDGTPGANDMPGRLVFSTTADGASSPTERMRISSSGALKVSNTGTYGSTAGRHEINQSLNQPALQVYATDSFIYQESVLFLLGSRNTTIGEWNFIHCRHNGVSRLFVQDNGNVQNVNNSYTGISDIKLKENILDAHSQWDDIKNLRVRNYNFKPETGHATHTQIGLIAQETELVSPGLVNETVDRDDDGNDLGTVTKSVNYSVLYMKAVKALQEAMERIEVLEAKVNALEGN